MRTLLLLALLFAGCGEDESEPAAVSPIVGEWLFDQGTSGHYVLFRADGTYNSNLMILDMAAKTGLSQVEDGDYTATDTSVSMIPLRASCYGANREQIDFVVSGNTLLVKDGAVSKTYARLDSYSEREGSSGFTIVTGCFSSNGDFSEAEIKDL